MSRLTAEEARIIEGLFQKMREGTGGHKELFRELGQAEHRVNERQSFEKTIKRAAAAGLFQAPVPSSKKKELARAQRDRLEVAAGEETEEEVFDFTEQVFEDSRAFGSLMSAKLIRRAVSKTMKDLNKNLDEAWIHLGIGKKHKVFCVPDAMLDGEWRRVAACVILNVIVVDEDVPLYVGKDGTRTEQVRAIESRRQRVTDEEVNWPDSARAKANRVFEAHGIKIQ